jgi:hypothetical protein
MSKKQLLTQKMVAYQNMQMKKQKKGKKTSYIFFIFLVFFCKVPLKVSVFNLLMHINLLTFKYIFNMNTSITTFKI